MSDSASRLGVIDFRLLKRFAPYVRSYFWLAAVAFVLMILTNLANVLEPYFVKVGIDKNVANGDWPGLLNTVLLLGVILVLGFILQFLFNITIQYLGQKLLVDVRMDLFRKVLALSNDYFDRTPIGRTLTHLTSDVEAVRQFISEGVVTVIGELLKVVFIFAAMMLVNIRLAVIAFFTLPIFLVATLIFRRRIRSGFADARKANAEINTMLVESISGINEIHLFGHEKTSRRRFDRANGRYLNAYLRVVNTYAVYFPVIEVVTNLGMVLVMLYAHLKMGITIQVGEIFVFFSYIQMFFRPMRQLAEKFNMFQSAMAAAERIFTLMDTPVSVNDTPEARPVKGEIRGDIQFDSVSFSYQPDQEVLDDVSFTIREGENVALVGTTGSGKSTIAKLISRLYDIQKGAIRIGGRDIRSIPIAQLRRAITTVPQDAFLFTGSAAGNISLYDPAVSRDQIEEAAGQVYADHFILRLPAGYDENLLEEGRSLSSGQKQLLSFARAFVRDSSVIILDEVTANIDSDTESMIERGMINLISGKTALIIAHRLSTIRLVDRILVFHRGRLVEQGSHSALMRRDGLYAQYYKMQSMLSVSGSAAAAPDK